MSRCDDKECTGGHFKFDDCVSDALWSAGPDWWDESGGSQDEFGAYCALVLAEEDFIVPDWAWSGGRDVTIPAGLNILLTGVSSGRVYVTYFDSPELAQNAYDAHDKAYGIWSEANGY